MFLWILCCRLIKLQLSRDQDLRFDFDMLSGEFGEFIFQRIRDCFETAKLTVNITAKIYIAT